MINAKISGIASYLPDYVLTNDELSHMVDTNDEWITGRVGIKERRILKKDVGSSYMGIQAVTRLLEQTGTSADDIDLLICATSNPDYRFPSTASVIIHGCGLEKRCYGYDIQAACAGFIVAAQDATAYIRSGIYRKVIVVCAEKMSSMVNYSDRATCPLFGDGAAAILLEPTTDGIGFIDAVFHVDGSGLENLVYKAGGSANPTTTATVEAGEHFLYQEGRAVYRHAVIDMLTATQEVMKRNDLTVDTIDWLVPHQANLRIIEAVGSRLGINPDKVLVNIEYVGNTSAASIPLCLDQNKQRLHAGDRVVLTAFGAGFTWGASYLIWSL
mgnify:CR=1 FL=1